MILAPRSSGRSTESAGRGADWAADGAARTQATASVTIRYMGRSSSSPSAMAGLGRLARLAVERVPVTGNGVDARADLAAGPAGIGDAAVPQIVAFALPFRLGLAGPVAVRQRADPGEGLADYLFVRVGRLLNRIRPAGGGFGRGRNGQDAG